MSARSLVYWLVCSTLAAVAIHAAEPAAMDPSLLVLPEAASPEAAILPVPEPGRAALLFAGIMAMAFTYRKVWLNWKRGS